MPLTPALPQINPILDGSVGLGPRGKLCLIKGIPVKIEGGRAYVIIDISNYLIFKQKKS